MVENKFKLSHVTLYAKGWYKHTDDIWADLMKILELDGYQSFDRRDVYNILVNSVQNSNLYRWTELREVLNGIHPDNCWKVGYWTKGCAFGPENNVEYDMATAFVYYVMSNLKFLETEKWTPVIPKYKRYPKSDNITIRKVIEHFNGKTLSVK